MIFSETLLKENDQIEIPNFSEIFRSDRSKNKLRGIICFSKSADISNIKYRSNFVGKGHFELLSFCYKGLNIITGYRSPQMPINEFKNNLIQILFNINFNNEKIILLGNFNIDLCQENNLSFEKFLFENYHLKSEFGKEIFTTISKSQLDIIFSNVEIIKTGIYEVYFSDHNLIYCKLLENSKKINKSQNFDFEIQTNTISTTSNKTVLSNNSGSNFLENYVINYSIIAKKFDPNPNFNINLE